MKKQTVLIFALLLFVSAIFFYPIFKGYIPFPGESLVDTVPYNSQGYLGYAPGGVPNKGQDPDVMHELFPWKFFVIDSLKRGQIPFWNPYNFSGNPLMANFQSAAFYPLNLLFLVLPFLTSWSVFILLSPFLAAIFMYLFLREIKLSNQSAIFGGITFAFSSYMVVWLEYGNITHTFLWLPLILYFTEKYFQKTRWYFILFITLSLWFAFLAGYIQGVFYILAVTLAYSFTKIPKFDKKQIKHYLVFVLAILFPILLSLFQLLPTLSLFSLATRGSYTYAQIATLLNPWWYSITVIFPDFFGNPATQNYWFNGTYIERVSYFGVIPSLFALSGLFSVKKKEMKVFAALFVISFFLSLDLFVTRFIYFVPIPTLSTTVPTRILSIFVFSGAVLASFGIENFLSAKQRTQYIIASLIGMLLLGIGWGSVLLGSLFLHFLPSNDLLITRHNLLLPSLLILFFMGIVWLRFFPLRESSSPFIFYLVILLLTCGDLFYFFHKITPFSPQSFIYPQTPVISYLQTHAGINRYWGYGAGNIASNFQTYDKTFSPEGFDALHLKLYTEFISASQNGKLAKQLSRDNATIAPGYGPTSLRSNPYRQKALNITGVKYVLSKNDLLGGNPQHDLTFPSAAYKLIWQEKPWQIYANKMVVPRFFLTTDFQVIANKQQALATFFRPTFNERKTIIVSVDPGMRKCQKGSFAPCIMGKVKLISYSPNSVKLQADAKTDSLLFLSDTYSPDWHVTIDGVQKIVLPADYAFRAVVVPKGQHRVTFFYHDTAFTVGLFLSGVSLVGFVAFVLLLMRKQI